MPLKIVAARNSKTPNLYIRGSYLGVSVDQSCRTDRRSVAGAILKRIEGQIERGEYGSQAPADRGQPTFVTAAVTYMDAGGEKKYMAALIRHFGETPLSEIDQAAIDAAAVELRPHASGATRNRCVYTPISSVLHRAGRKIAVTRPKGAKGKVVNAALTPDDAAIVIWEATAIDREYGLFLRVLLYTGCRLGEALALNCDDVRPTERRAWIAATKNGDPREVRLRDAEADDLAELIAGRTGRVFRFHQGGHLKHLLTRAKLGALQMDCPARRPTGWRQPPNRLAWLNHHSFRHTWATWFRRYAGGDVEGMIGTRNWRDPRSGARYVLVLAREEWTRIDHFPDVGKIRGPKAS